MRKRLIAIFLAIIITISCLPLGIFAVDNEKSNPIPSSAVIYVENTYCIVGKEVTVDICISNNPGIAGAKFKVLFDDGLTLIGASDEGGVFESLDYTAPKNLENLCPFNWDSLDAVANDDGKIIKLTFAVDDDFKAGDKLNINLLYNYGDVYDSNLNSVSVTMVNGTLDVIDYVPGDADGDGVVNGKDVTLIRRHNADWDVNINLLAADVNSDGVINGKDVTQIRRYNADWDIELLPGLVVCEHSLTSVMAKEATCTEVGNIAYWQCILCDKIFSDAKGENETTVSDLQIPPNGAHNEVTVSAVLPTCTTTGLTEGSCCSVCNTVIKAQNVVPATGHTYIWSIDKEATQSETGLKHEYCYLCSGTRNENTVIPLAPHTHSFEYTTAVPATCTQDGRIEHWTCTDCGKIYRDALGVNEIVANDVVIKAKGHTECIVEAVGATCLINGKTESSFCGDCNAVLKSGAVIPATGHSYVNDICTKCGIEDNKPLKVTSVSADKSLLMANEQVTFSAITNKNSDKITMTATVYLDGTQVAKITGKGNLQYTPTVAGRYDVEISVTNNGIDIFTFYLKSCFDVKPYWSLTDITSSAANLYLGEPLKFESVIIGDTTDLDYTITVYKDGISHYSIDRRYVEFYPNSAGSYYAEIVVTDKYGESKTAQSGNVAVSAQTVTNPVLSVNYGTTLNVDELNRKDGDEVIVPAGKNIILNWNKLSTDSYYRLDVYACNNDSDTYDEVFKNYTSNSYTISSINLIAGHEYCAMVSRYDASGHSLGTIYVDFTVGGANSIMLEKRFEITSPVDDGVYAQNDITVQWTKLNYASKYVLSLEYHCGQSYHDVLENIGISNTQNSYTIPKSLLHQGCKHRLRMYAYDSLGNELYESIVFRMEGDAAIFELDKPEITATYFYEDWTDDMKSYPTYEDIVVTWTDIPAASYYSITIDSKYTFIDDPILLNADQIKENIFTIPINSLVSGCVYSVKVTAYCEEGHKKISKMKYFRVPYADGSTIHGPNITSHDFSKDESEPTCMVEQPLTITWAPVSAAVSYSVYWSEKGYEEWPEYEIKNITTNTVTIPNDCIYTSGEYTDFELRIVAKDSNSIWEEAYYYVRLLESNIEAPIVTSPYLATDDEGDMPSFDDDFTITWNAVPGAVS